MRHRVIVMCALVLAVAVLTIPAIGKSKNDDPFKWTDDYSLILTSNQTEDQSDETVNYINDNGGSVAIMVSPRMLLGWANDSMVGQHGITAVHKKPIALGLLKNSNIDEQDSLKFFNDVASGNWTWKKSATYGEMPWSGPDQVAWPNATSNGVSPVANDIAQSYPGTSDIMAGKIRYNVFFVESDGSIDSNFYSWSCADLTSMVSEISAGLSFWTSKAATYGTPLTWSPSYQRPSVYSGATLLCAGTSNVKQGYEPIYHPGATNTGYDGDALWVNKIMEKYGYGAAYGYSLQRVYAYNNASRTTNKTNWATSLFVAYNPSSAPTTFTNGYFAYCYVPNGPYAQILFRNDGWAFADNDRITAHETGHMFGADDEYASSGCNNCTVGDASSKNVVNGNCANCNVSSVDCMMKGNTSVLCGYTPGQIGWGMNITKVHTPPASTSTADKTNYTPGQAVNYKVYYAIPGRPGEPVTMRFRFYVVFQNGITYNYDTGDMAGWNTTGGSNWTNLGASIPANAPYGEATLTVQMETKYASGYYYGRGIRASARGKIYVVPGANSIPTSPVQPELSTGIE